MRKADACGKETSEVILREAAKFARRASGAKRSRCTHARAREYRGEKEEKRREEETVEDGGAGNYARTEYSQLRGCCTAQKSVI